MAMAMALCRAVIFSILVTLSFAATNISNRDITIATHNLHGFSTSSAYLKDSIHSRGGIWMIQEHWLSENQLHKLQQLNCQFVARSGMENAISTGIYRGRPFGGVAICWSPDINHLITPVSNFKHKRVVAVEMNTDNIKILCICVYMPYFNASRREQCMTESYDAIAMVELLIEEHPNHSIVIGGDFNTELKGESPFDPMWNQVVTKNSLTYCDSFVSSPKYTYRHDTLNQTKFNDHFIVSQSLINQNMIQGHKILDDGDNNSDHLPLMMTMALQFCGQSRDYGQETGRKSLIWKKLSLEAKANYSSVLEELLLQRTDPLQVSVCRHSCGCVSQNCRNDIQREYDEIRSAILSASAPLPKTTPGTEKDWWSPQLTQIRDQSIAIQEVWIGEGRPRQGPTYQERLRVRATYKNAIRIAKKAPNQATWNRLHTAMETNNTDSFWKHWRSIYGKNKSQFSPVVDGQSTKEGIANVFKEAFHKNSQPNNQDKVDDLNNRFNQNYAQYSANHANNCDCSEYCVTLDMMIDAICGMTPGKSSDDDGLHAEHFQNAPLVLIIKLTSLFNFMLSHAFVPSQFRFGTIIPIIKDRHGSASDVSNYRGITISPMISKVFEHVLKLLFSQHLSTSCYQYGFKKQSSTTHALYSLRTTINYYIDHGSRVYSSFLDASKAFDRLVHSGLFLKLIERNIPKRMLDILVTWYNGLQCRVKWDGFVGSWFDITAGVRQGGVLSPDFYNIYVDGLIYLLQKSGAGCYMHQIFAAAQFYADDMNLIAPSLKGLQRLLNICSEYCTEWDICLNPRKTKNIVFGKSSVINHKLTLDNSDIEWVCEWKYLGVVLRSGKRFGCSVSERVKSFYRSLNSILRVEGRSDDMVLLRLIESHCVPILTYAIEVTDVANRDERRSLRVAYNSVYRKIFGYRYFESVTILQHSLERLTWEETIEKRQTGFLKRARNCDSSSLVYLLSNRYGL